MNTFLQNKKVNLAGDSKDVPISVYISFYCYSWYFLPYFLCRDEVEKVLDSKELDVDGRLSFEEFMGEPSRAEKLFKLMDKDGDGFVTKNVRNTSLAAPWALSHRLQRCNECKIQNGRQGSQNGKRGLERGLALGYWLF